MPQRTTYSIPRACFVLSGSIRRLSVGTGCQRWWHSRAELMCLVVQALRDTKSVGKRWLLPILMSFSQCRAAITATRLSENYRKLNFLTDGTGCAPYATATYSPRMRAATSHVRRQESSTALKRYHSYSP